MANQYSKGDDVIIRQPLVTEIGAIRTLRHEELLGDVVPAMPFEPTEADLRAGVIHMAAFMGDDVISAVRLEPAVADGSVYRVSRMVTKAAYRGHGIGASVLQTAEQLAIDSGGREFILDARPKAEPFYKRLGYNQSTDRATAKADNIPMIKRVNG